MLTKTWRVFVPACERPGAALAPFGFAKKKLLASRDAPSYWPALRDAGRVSAGALVPRGTAALSAPGVVFAHDGLDGGATVFDDHPEVDCSSLMLAAKLLFGDSQGLGQRFARYRSASRLEARLGGPELSVELDDLAIEGGRRRARRLRCGDCGGSNRVCIAPRTS